MQHKQPVILQVIPELGPGGAEQGCIDVATAIQKAGGRALVISHSGDRVYDLVRSGAQHITLPVHSKNPFVMWRNIYRLRNIIRREGVDIVHARSRAPAWSAYFAVRGTQAKFITTCHALYNIHNRFKRAYNRIMAKGVRVIAISRAVSDYLQREYGMDAQNIRIIHRGVPMEKFNPAHVTPERMINLAQLWRIPEGAHVVMLPGRLTRWKGHHVLIEAIARLGRSDVFALLIGSDQGRSAYTQELHDLIAKHGLEGQVRIVDHCTDMPAAYMLAEIVVSASTEPEGFGRIPVEAQAMGRLVIATDHGGAAETVLPDETGFLVPPGDASALCDKIRDILALDEQTRMSLAFRGMQNARDRFSKDRMTTDTLKVYNEIMDGKAFEIKTDTALLSLVA